MAFTKVVTTKGRDSQNHGRSVGITNIMIITIAEIKKYSHHFPVPSVVFISFNLGANINAIASFIKISLA